MEGIALVLMLFELIGLKIIFDVALRDVGTTPSWDMDILYSHLTGETGTWRQGFVCWSFLFVKAIFTFPIEYAGCIAACR